MTSKLVMSPSISDISKVVPPHLFETFCQSTNYSDFEADVIGPAIHAACSQAPDPGCPVFSVPHPSLEETLQFLLDTDYNYPGHKLHLPPPLPTLKLSTTICLTRMTSVVAISVTNTPTATYGRVDILRKGLMLCWVQHIGKQR